MLIDPQAEVANLPGELVTLIARQAINEGPNASVNYSGLTFYRYEQPVATNWGEVPSPVLCMVVQGRKRVRMGTVNYFYDPFHYLVIKRGLRFQYQIMQGSSDRPFFSFVLQLPPRLITEINDEINRLVPEALSIEPAPATPDIYVTALETSLVEAVQRFLQALELNSEREVLAPLYLREIIYRLLRSEQRQWLLENNSVEIQGNAVGAAIAVMRQELHQTLTVRELAEAVSMSESNFAHTFKASTGVSPLQFLKQIRLEQARKFLLGGASVSEVADSVGYSSLSHFTSEFKRHFGESPKAYVQKLRSLDLATTQYMSQV